MIMKNNRWIALGMSAVMALGLAACGSAGSSTGSSTAGAADSTAATESTAAAGNSAAAGASEAAPAASDRKFTVGVLQLVQHPALDAATQGFVDVLKETYGDNVTIDSQNAAGDSATCATIANTFVSNKYDLIMANATPALQAAAAATSDIPVLGTSVTEYGVALGIDNFSGTVGTNVSGTSDLAPLDQQAAMFADSAGRKENRYPVLLRGTELGLSGGCREGRAREGRGHRDGLHVHGLQRCGFCSPDGMQRE